MCERIWADSSGHVLKFQAAWTKRLLSRMVHVQHLVSKYSNPWVTQSWALPSTIVAKPYPTEECSTRSKSGSCSVYLETLCCISHCCEQTLTLPPTSPYSHQRNNGRHLAFDCSVIYTLAFHKLLRDRGANDG